MKLSGDEARSIVWAEDVKNWESASGQEIVDTTRWSICFSRIFKFIPTSRFYRFEWQSGATECQDERPFQYEDEYEPIEVAQIQVTKMEWIEVS